MQTNSSQETQIRANFLATVVVERIVALFHKSLPMCNALQTGIEELRAVEAVFGKITKNGCISNQVLLRRIHSLVNHCQALKLVINPGVDTNDSVKTQLCYECKAAAQKLEDALEAHRFATNLSVTDVAQSILDDRVTDDNS